MNNKRIENFKKYYGALFYDYLFTNDATIFNIRTEDIIVRLKKIIIELLSGE